MSEESNRSKIGVIIGVVVFVLGVAVASWYLFVYQPQQEALERERLEQIAKEEAERKRKELEAQKKVQYDSLIAQANTAFEQEDWETAKSLYTEASAIFPNEQYPKDQLALIQAKLDALAARNATGTVELVESRTGRFYIIVTTNVDDDLAMDYANKLAKEGINVKMLSPFSNRRVYHRISVADYATAEQAEAALASFSAFGDVWVMKY
ncbi:MAG: SPOR domain-containing protein [Cyclobacteriaceae bacterium]